MVSHFFFVIFRIMQKSRSRKESTNHKQHFVWLTFRGRVAGVGRVEGQGDVTVAILKRRHSGRVVIRWDDVVAIHKAGKEVAANSV